MTQADTNELQQQIIDLESKLAFQEDAVLALNNELLEHQKRIEKLQRQVLLLAEKLSRSDNSDILRPEEEPPPPHY
ncbi:SlyX family protein [Rheinheimera sp.]|uniref:SlyX family protein n=1 Tax=Rheinheimera sp. TaxID=1869214 RepID=UPI00307FC6A8